MVENKLSLHEYVKNNLGIMFATALVDLLLVNLINTPIVMYCRDNTILNVWYWTIWFLLIPTYCGFVYFLWWLFHIFFKLKSTKRVVKISNCKHWYNLVNINFEKEYELVYYRIPFFRNYVVNCNEIE